MSDKEKMNALLDVVVSIIKSLRLVGVLAGDNLFVVTAINKIITETTLSLQKIK